MEIEGRPVFAIAGDDVAYRDLVGGTEGPDVEVLQRALIELGYNPGILDGIYGAETASAVEQLYRDSGYHPPAPLVDSSELAAASDDVQATDDLLQLAETELALARTSDANETGDTEINESTLLSLELAVDGARRERQRARHELAQLQRDAATPFPILEYQFVDGLPTNVVALPGQPGSQVDGPAVQLSSDSHGVVVAAVVRDVARRISIGQEAEISFGDGDSSLGLVSWIADVVGPGPSEERYGLLELVPPDQVAVEIKVESAVQVDIDTPALVSFDLNLGDELGPVVPLAAIRSSADGSSWVVVLTDDGQSEAVEVEVKATLDGAAAIAAPGLEEGDRVVLG